MYNDIKINGVVLDIVPSSITMSYDIIKSIERSLDGTLNVDFEQKKQRIKIVFDLIGQAQFENIQQQFDADKENGIAIEYLDNRQAQCLVDDIFFEPWLVGNDLQWRNVVVDLLEM